jgi:hypothetical protein
MKGVRALSFLPDGKSLVSVNAGDTVSIWDATSGKELRSSKCTRNARLAVLAPDGKTLAIASAEGSISLWDVGAMRERVQFEGHQAGVSCLAFSPDGKLLASGSEDATILVWDVEGRVGTKKPVAVDGDALWDTLGGDNVIDVHWAIAALVEIARRRPSLILDRVRPLIRPNEAQVLRLIKLLVDEDFETREKAERELATLADLAEPSLRRALADKPSPELRQRVERLLARLESPVFSAREFRLQRSVEILERAATEEARLALETISKNAPGRWLREMSKAAEERLYRRQFATKKE